MDKDNNCAFRNKSHKRHQTRDAGVRGCQVDKDMRLQRCLLWLIDLSWRLAGSA